MSQHDASPHERDAARPVADTGDGRPVADVPGPRTARRRMLVWLAIPVAIALGAGGGYLAAEAWTPDNRPPAATAAGHSSHEVTAPQTHDSAQVPGEHGSHDHAAAERPRTAVLAGFAVVNAAVLLAAAVLRRRRPRPTRRTAAAPTA